MSWGKRIREAVARDRALSREFKLTPQEQKARDRAIVELATEQQARKRAETERWMREREARRERECDG